MAILTFRHKGLQRFFTEDDHRGIPPALAPRLADMLAALDCARTLASLRVFPGWRLHSLSGHLEGWWSLTVSGNWRLVFRFSGGNALDVDFVDYH